MPQSVARQPASPPPTPAQKHAINMPTVVIPAPFSGCIGPGQGRLPRERNERRVPEISAIRHQAAADDNPDTVTKW